MIIFNLKNYKPEHKKLSEIMRKHFKTQIVCPPITQIGQYIKKNLIVFSQHVSSYDGQRGTGFLTIEQLKSQGLNGSILNHSEHPIKEEEIKKTIKIANKKKFKIILCVSSLKQAKIFKNFSPWAIAYEDKKLISTSKSIIQENISDVKKFVNIIGEKKIKKICGAGIKNKEDIIEAKKIGCDGVLIASAFAKSKNPEKFAEKIK